MNLQVLMECFLCTPFSPSAQYLPLLCETSINVLHPQETAACFQRSILFASTFIREISCLLHVKKPETPPVLSDSRRHSDWKVTAVLITQSLSKVERVQDQAGSSTCDPDQARSDRSHLCASGTALPSPRGLAGNLLLLKPSAATTCAD